MDRQTPEMIVKRIKELPPLPLVVQKLLQVVGDDNSNANDLTKVLSSDQALTGKVLKLVNSSFYGFPGKISTLTRAVVILGYNAIRNLAIGLSAYDTLKKIRGPVDWQGFWTHAITCAAAAHTLAKHTDYPEPEEAFIAGLIHDIGYFVINITSPDMFEEMLQAEVFGDLAKEEDLIGINHAQVGIRLLEHWKLPEVLCRTARFHHSLNHIAKDKLVNIVMLSDIMAHVKGSEYAEKGEICGLQEAADSAGIPMGEFSEILVEIDSRVEEARAFLNIAEDGGRAPDEMDVEEMVTLVVISADDQRRNWTESLLKGFGHHVLSTAVLSQKYSGPDEAGLVLLDQSCINNETAAKLASALKSKGIPVALIFDDTKINIPDGLIEYPRLPLIFNKKAVRRLMKEV